MPQNFQFAKAYVVCIVSMLAGAAVVHNIYKPDLVPACHAAQHPRARLATDHRYY